MRTLLKTPSLWGGDADTMACIAAGIAQAYYKTIPAEIVKRVREKLPREFLTTLDQFETKYDCKH